MGNTLGLDIGIGSIGSALISDNNKVVYMGVRMFNPAQEASTSRIHRSQRRNLSRKRWRKEQLIDAFDDFGIIKKENPNERGSKALPNGYLQFTTDNELIKRPIDKTVYHLRFRALNQQVSKREILLCLYNILHARGHFLNETIDFKNGKTVTFEDYSELFYEICFDNNVDTDVKKALNEILKYTFNEKVSQKDLKAKLKNIKTVIDEDILEKLENTFYLICGYVANIKKINDSFSVDKEKCSVKQLKELDEIDDYLSACVELYDLAQIHKIMKDKDYLCEVAVEKLDEFYEVIEKYGKDSDEFKEYQNNLKGNSAKEKQKHIRVVRNLANGYPNGLYLKECNAILKKQQEFYKEISDEFIKVCEDIISARIPYYIGPLNEKGKNAWLIKKDNFKYSYSYSKDDAVDVNLSVKKWKERMISHCTYLPECDALPKGSFISETFNILNELNILRAIDKDNNDYYLTKEDKIKVFDKLFLRENKVAYEDIAEILDLKSFGPKSGKGQYFNNAYTLYFSIKTIIPELALDSIYEFSKKNKKIEEIESIILGANLYDEEISKIEYFRKDKGYSEDVSKKLAKLKSKSFCSYSKEFVLETPIDAKGNSIIDKLFEDNHSTYVNEQMTIISNATDSNGNPKDYLSNKYKKRIEKNNNELNYKILVDDEKPIIPISRPVLRSLNECMKVYLGIIEAYGVPERVVVETARDLPDFSVVKEKTVKFADNAERQYKFLLDQLNNEFKAYKNYSNLEKYEEIKEYINRNKTKISLYISQLGTDLLTGEKIYLNNLDDYEVDHILPRGFGDDSMNDKMLIAKKVNSKKGNRLPIEFINSCEKVDGHKICIESDYLKNVSALFEIGAISEKKYKRLTLKNQKDLDEFLNQNLVDTRYIIREFMSILRAYNDIKRYNTNIVALKSAYTSTYRKAFRMDKVREYGDQHHAHDAALLCIADRTLSSYYPYYDKRAHNKLESANPFESYNSFIAAMRTNDEEKKDELNRFIRYTYEKAFGEPERNADSLINQVKNYVPYYSVKVERNYKGQYFDLNPLSQKEYKDDSVLSIIGVNDDKKVFSGVNCACVDFYKYTNKKGNKVHLAVHIPKVIIDKDGNVDKEKYLKLIKEHYKALDLIDENGNLKEGYFRFRAFENDLVYETKHKTIFKFNMGSIELKALEFKYVNIFSYNDVYKYGFEICNDIKREFNIKDRINKDGVELSSIDKREIVAYINAKYFKLEINDKKLDAICNKIKDDKTLKEISNHLAYLGLIVNRPLTPPKIEGKEARCIRTANMDFNKNDTNVDAIQYVKLKYNILGIKFYTNVDGGFIIQSPLQGKFKKITKEKFSWQISKKEI